MKNITPEEKLNMVNDACDLLTEGIGKIKEAKKILHSCGIDICGNVDTSDVYDLNLSGSNVQIFRGIPKMEKIIGANGYHPTDEITGKQDRSRKKLKYRGITFLQLANKSNTKFGYR